MHSARARSLRVCRPRPRARGLRSWRTRLCADRWNAPHEQRDAAVMTEPSIATDSCHHPTGKAKAYSLVQLFFLLICIISMLLSLAIRSSSVLRRLRSQLVLLLDERLKSPPCVNSGTPEYGWTVGPGFARHRFGTSTFGHVPIWAAGCLPVFPAALLVPIVPSCSERAPQSTVVWQSVRAGLLSFVAAKPAPNFGSSAHLQRPVAGSPVAGSPVCLGWDGVSWPAHAVLPARRYCAPVTPMAADFLQPPWVGSASAGPALKSLIPGARRSGAPRISALHGVRWRIQFCAARPAFVRAAVRSKQRRPGSLLALLRCRPRCLPSHCAADD
jgi:hypothetical protein